MPPTAVVLALWAAWLIAGRTTARTVLRPSPLSQLAHLVPIWAGALLLVLHVRRPEILEHRLLPGRPWSAWLSVVVVASGLGFAGWARSHLGRFWSGTVTLKAGHVLIRTGPYARTRHPIYAGLLVAFGGTAAMRGTVGALVGMVLFTIGFALRMDQEERLLVEHLGAAYQAFRQEVPALIPRLRSRPSAAPAPPGRAARRTIKPSC